jgi:hypothetical protein
LGRDGERYEVIWLSRESKYFCKGDSTGEQVICPSGKISAPAGQINRALSSESLPRT